MVTETHTVHSHWNTHSTLSLEHTVHGLKTPETQYQVSETHIYTGYGQFSDKISWYIPWNIHTPQKWTSLIHLNQQLPYKGDFLRLPGSVVAGPVPVLLAFGTDTSMVLGGLAFRQSMVASTVEAAVFWSAKNPKQQQWASLVVLCETFQVLCSHPLTSFPGECMAVSLAVLARLISLLIFWWAFLVN